MKLIYFFIGMLAFSANAQQTEAINWDEARVNGNMELTISKRDFEKIYKKADSIVTPDYSQICGTDADSNFQYYHYKGLMYELDNGIMNFRKLTFSKKSSIYFTYKGQKLDAGTRLEDLKAFFPDAVKEADNTKGETSLLLDSADVMDDSNWRLTFKNGYLVGIECFFPC